jgi:hypothetical protein
MASIPHVMARVRRTHGRNRRGSRLQAAAQSGSQLTTRNSQLATRN